MRHPRSIPPISPEVVCTNVAASVSEWKGRFRHACEILPVAASVSERAVSARHSLALLLRTVCWEESPRRRCIPHDGGASGPVLERFAKCCQRSGHRGIAFVAARHSLGPPGSRWCR